MVSPEKAVLESDLRAHDSTLIPKMLNGLFGINGHDVEVDDGEESTETHLDNTSCTQEMDLRGGGDPPVPINAEESEESMKTRYGNASFREFNPSNATRPCQHSVKTQETDSTCASNNYFPSSPTGDQQEQTLTLQQRYASSIARHPIIHVLVTIVLLIGVCVVVFMLGNLNIRTASDGWLSRGTLIASRQTQASLLSSRKEGKRVNDTTFGTKSLDNEDEGLYCSGQWYGSESMLAPNELNFISMWKTADSSGSSLNANMLYEMCIAEEYTLDALEEKDLCHRCPIENDLFSSRCLQPYSLVLLARIYLTMVGGNMDIGSKHLEHLVPSISCESLRSQWAPAVQEQFVRILRDCSHYLLGTDDKQLSCMQMPVMPATLVDKQFPSSGLVKYSSSIYATKNDDPSIQSMYSSDLSGLLSKNPGLIEQVNEVSINSMYTTPRLGFYERYLNEIIPRQAAIGFGSSLVTFICILIHTRSVFLTLFGLLQIIAALPLSYAIYYFIFGLHYFGLINLLAIFIVFSLGADDIFVAVDKWKAARNRLPSDYTTEQVATQVLPEMAYATGVTSLTTSVAFFSGAVMKIPQMTLFSIYCGLLVATDYILCTLLVFPALCIYDKKMTNNGGNATDQEQNSDSSIDSQPASQSVQADSTIHRILNFYYNKILHKFRWELLSLSFAAIVLCSIVTASMHPPDVVEPSFLLHNNSYEVHRTWARELLLSRLANEQFGRISFVWGLSEIDNGSYMNPLDPSTIELDQTFDMTSEESQLYMLDMCDAILENNFTRTQNDRYECPMKALNNWLEKQASTASPQIDYAIGCQGSRSVPIQKDMFNRCIIAFATSVHNNDILHDGQKVMALRIQARSNTTYHSSVTDQAEEWHALETWVKTKQEYAPEGVGSFFFSSEDFHIYDTFSNMQRSAYQSMLITLLCASAVILVTSRSLLMVLLSATAMGYVLVATSACLVGLGWTIGIYEAALLCILIGISCDYVLHFSHAYAMDQCHSREAKTIALHEMGPSVLGSATTTLLPALIMLLTEIKPFRQFGVLLALTTIHSVIGSFVVFLSMCDCISSVPMASCQKSLLSISSTTASEDSDCSPSHIMEAEV